MGLSQNSAASELLNHLPHGQDSCLNPYQALLSEAELSCAESDAVDLMSKASFLLIPGFDPVGKDERGDRQPG